MQLGQLIASATLVVLVAQQGAAAEDRPRARELGIAPRVLSQARSTQSQTLRA